MHLAAHKRRASELREAIAISRRLLIGVGLFSIFVNLLMLTGPLFMLQIYDRVLASGSEETLLALFGLVAVLFLIMGLLDHARTSVLTRVGARFHSLLDIRVCEAAVRGRVDGAERDLDAVQRALASPASFALLDMPWTPIFIAAIFLFHWSLGLLAVAGGLLLFVIALFNQWRARLPAAKSYEAARLAESFAETVRRENETVIGLGMRDNAVQRQVRLRHDALAANIGLSDATRGLTVASKTLRLFLQSAILALGAWLAIGGEITPGVMIAASILMGRALAPVEQGIAQWSVVQRALLGWSNLRQLLERTPPGPVLTALPRPTGHLSADAVTAFAPGSDYPTIRNISFQVAPGDALGVIGPSAAGKSVLARVLVGAWPVRAGTIRLDGATLPQYSPGDRGKYIGYLPQDVTLFDATVAENISRLAEYMDDEAVVEAAKRAGAHELILQLPQGYDTVVGTRGTSLSGGQRQRIGLARALYGDPVVVVLDEPNSSLDAHGEQALIAAIRELKERERAVVVIAHRPSAIAACDRLLVLDRGRPRAYGPRDQVLRETTANYTQVVAARGPTAVARATDGAS